MDDLSSDIHFADPSAIDGFEARIRAMRHELLLADTAGIDPHAAQWRKLALAALSEAAANLCMASLDQARGNAEAHLGAP